MRLLHEDGRTVCGRCVVADSPWRRALGLMGRRSLDPDEGLLIRPTNGIHMLFMRFPIDALFLDDDLVVLRVVERLRPWRAAVRSGARAVVELPAGAAAGAGVREGMRLRLEP